MRTDILIILQEKERLCIEKLAKLHDFDPLSDEFLEKQYLTEKVILIQMLREIFSHEDD
jgi:hypothetical protein